MAEAQSTRTCSIDGCEKRFYSRGWCKLHYERWSTSGHPLGKPCRGCGKHFEGQFYCAECKPVCSIGGCGAKVNARGLCSRHYMRIVHNGQSAGAFRARHAAGPPMVQAGTAARSAGQGASRVGAVR